ncbi:MAG: chemotaxis protein CheW [Bacteriovoracaceae bacterium]
MSGIEQLTTFYVGHELFGIEVMKVQEVTGNPHVVPVPLAPEFVKGLVNLRGQIATAISLSELFAISGSSNEENMSVVCKNEGNLVSLIVSSIGDVVEVSKTNFERSPDILPSTLKKYVKGIYKMEGILLSVLDIESIFKELSPIESGRN